jgi:DNA-binding response OmpR family regulator
MRGVEQRWRAGIEIYLADPNNYLLQPLRNALVNEGFQKAHDFIRFDDLQEAIKRFPPDLMVLDTELPGGDTCELVSDLRHNRIGDNPFVPVIMTTWEPTQEIVAKVADSGADDLLVKPISPGQLMDRMLTLVRRRKPFSVTSDYVGPDRRDDPEREETTIPLIEVPNTLSTKAKGEVVDYDTLQEEIDGALLEVNDQKLSRHAYQVAFLVGLILPVYENKRRPNKETLEHIQRLSFVAKDIARRLGGTRFDHVSELCETLINVADSIEQTYRRPNPRDLKLLKSLSDAVLAGFHPNREVAAMATEISKSINKFRLK